MVVSLAPVYLIASGGAAPPANPGTGAVMAVGTLLEHCGNYFFLGVSLLLGFQL